MFSYQKPNFNLSTFVKFFRTGVVRRFVNAEIFVFIRKSDPQKIVEKKRNIKKAFLRKKANCIAKEKKLTKNCL